MSARPVPQEQMDDVATIAVYAPLCHAIYQTAVDRGHWWGRTLETHGPEKVALLHSECSEVLEAMRNGRWTATMRPATKEEVEKFGVREVRVEAVLEELADVEIRQRDMLGRGVHEGRWTIAAYVDALFTKMSKNKQHDGSNHGKRF